MSDHIDKMSVPAPNKRQTNASGALRTTMIDSRTAKEAEIIDVYESSEVVMTNKDDRPIIDVDDQDGDPVEDRIIMESVVAIDTTDKRRGFRGIAVGSREPRNTYAAKKTVAQGMMDVALITANANQLQYLITFKRDSPTFFIIVFFIVVSLLLQIAVGVSLIFKGRFDIKGKGKSPQARKINNYVVAAVFLITIFNVFIASFSVIEFPPASINVPAPPPASTT